MEPFIISLNTSPTLKYKKDGQFMIVLNFHKSVTTVAQVGSSFAFQKIQKRNFIKVDPKQHEYADDNAKNG